MTRTFTTIFEKIVQTIFYGNYFYGLCVVAAILETAIQLGIPNESGLMYSIAFVATVLFYNYPYARNYSPVNSNPRTLWYIEHAVLVKRTQIVLSVIIVILGVWFVLDNRKVLPLMTAQQWFLVLIFPLTGALYYGSNIVSKKYNLRQVGWLKPFIIGFVWSGVTTIYPLLYDTVKHSVPLTYSFFLCLLFVKNLMFVSVLAIMFDIKDYVGDSKNGLNTLVVKMGLRKTILYVLLPLPVLGLITFISYAAIHHFSPLKMLLIMCPFLLLLVAAASLRKRRTLLYYLIMIDGLFIVKAVFDILAMLI
jgi:4-hydroxybenzoate polyprenyltransferase